MARKVWKGAIVFGLVHIPVTLYPAAKPNEMDFDLLDSRDMAPIGYERINKRTRKPVEWGHIVKGYQYEDGRYVVMSDEDFRQANPKATQTVEILAFVEGAAIEPKYFDTPYRLVPDKRGEKGYTLLRETLKRARKVGIAKVVIRTRQYLATLLPQDDFLVLQTLRYADELIPESELEQPPASLKAAGVSAREVKMAEQLVADMTEPWKPGQYKDTYRNDLLARVKQKVKAGETELVTQPGKEKPAEGGAQIIDLMAALKSSIESGKRRPASARAPAGKAAKTARRAPPNPARRASAKQRKRA
jgi:DNA end-binding protein Ku